MKTIFTFKNGKTRKIEQRIAYVLDRAGLGTYETRELRATDPAFPGTPDTRTIAEVDAQIKADNAEIEQEVAEQDEATDELDGLSVGELRELAEQRGLNVHHRAGAEKIRAALRGDGDE